MILSLFFSLIIDDISEIFVCYINKISHLSHNKIKLSVKLYLNMYNRLKVTKLISSQLDIDFLKYKNNESEKIRNLPFDLNSE